MEDRLRGLETAVRELQQSVARIEQRLDAIEASALPAPFPLRAQPDQPDLPAPPDLPALPAPDLTTLLSYTGRMFVALGGAFLLRALTDAKTLPLPEGTALGLVYALAWLVMSDRAAAAGRRTSALFHALVAVIIAYPLVWESVVHFQLLTANGGAIALTILTAITLAAAVRQRSQPMAWMAVLASVAAALSAVAVVGAVLPFTAVMILLAIGTLWIGYAVNWVMLRWPATIVADILTLALALRASGGSWPDPPAAVIALQLLLLTGHVASVAARTLVRGREVNLFEVVQTALALLVGLGGAVSVARATGLGATPIAGMTLLAGTGCYGVAFAFLARQGGLRRNFFFYTSLGLLLVVVSTALLLTDVTLALAWAAGAILAMWLGWWNARATLQWHAAVYVLAAAIASGLLRAAAAALGGPAGAAWPPMTPVALVVLAGTAACWLIPAAEENDSSSLDRWPRLAIAALLAATAGGWMVNVMVSALSHGATPGVDAGTLATCRTSVLAAAALAVAAAGRARRFRESGWLLYPLLALGGVKLLAEDLPRSQPATLFIALALYGGALIVAPRIGRRR